MELKHIKELMAAMGRTGIKRINLKKEDFELLIERSDDSSNRYTEQQLETLEENLRVSQTSIKMDQALSRGSEIPADRFHAIEERRDEKQDVLSAFVTSPMVGTFYNSPAPDAPAFIKVGDKIEKGDIVCIIEAMKVMNEIKSTIRGVIAEVLVDTSQPVEFGTKLFRVVE